MLHDYYHPGDSYRAPAFSEKEFDRIMPAPGSRITVSSDGPPPLQEHGSVNIFFKPC